MPRTVIVGDVHGCLGELEELLGRVALREDDRLYFVGDLIARGPDTLGVLALVRRLGAVVVRGNHEHKLLGYVRGRQGEGPRVRLGPNHIELTNQLSEEDWELLRNMPLWHDLPEHDMLHVPGADPGAADRLGHHQPAQVGRRERLQRSAEIANRRANPADDVDVGCALHLVSLNSRKNNVAGIPSTRILPVSPNALAISSKGTSP